MREVIITSILWGLHQKNPTFWRVLLTQVQEIGTGTSMALNFYTSSAKGFKLKSRKFHGLISIFKEITGEKLIEGCVLFPHHKVVRCI